AIGEMSYSRTVNATFLAQNMTMLGWNITLNGDIRGNGDWLIRAHQTFADNVFEAAVDAMAETSSTSVAVTAPNANVTTDAAAKQIASPQLDELRDAFEPSLGIPSTERYRDGNETCS